MAFPLYSKPAKEWLEWAPKIPLVPVTLQQKNIKADRS
jgi:hypothetical protein